MKNSVKPKSDSHKKNDEIIKKILSKKFPIYSHAEISKLIYELDVHQIELEMQNHELILAKEQMALAVEKYTELYAFAPIGLLTLSKNMIILELNLSCAHILNKERVRLKGSNFNNYLSYESSKIFFDFFEKIFISKRKESCELTILNNNNITYLYLTGLIVEDNNQCNINMIDITERKKIEKKLIQQEYFFEQMFMQSSISTQILDSEGWCEKINPKLSEMFGVKSKNIEGKLYNIFNDEAIIHGGVIPYLEKVFYSGKTAEWEILFDIGKAANSQNIDVEKKEKVWYSNWSYPIFDKDGKINRVIIQHTNISDSKQAEENLKNKMSELTIAYKQLEQYIFDNKELKQFAYISSHDLQEPLRTITNYIQIIKKDYSTHLDNTVNKYLNAMNDATKRMIILINALSDYSRLGHDKKLQSIDCKHLINDVIGDLDLLIKNSNAIIDITEMPTLNVYDVEIRQLFQNLISNAIKFQEKDNQPKIQISSEKINGKWKFSVKDNGIGIASEYHERIFDIFQRLHANDDDYKGNGIGLAFCKKIVQLHHGEIWAESNIGQGTTFYFTIPNLTM